MAGKYILLCALAIATLPTRSQNALISVKDQLEDLSELKTNFEAYHSGLYRYTSKDSIDLIFGQVQSRLKETSILDFYREVTWLLNKVKCGHTRSSLPNNVFDDFKNDHLFMPISVKYLGDKLVVDKKQEGLLLEKGQTILSINGNPIKEVTSEIFSHFSSDGLINSGKYRQLERLFGFYYQLYIDINSKCYDLEIESLDGEKQDISVNGVMWDEFIDVRRPKKIDSSLSLDIRPNYALLDIRTFDSRTINSNGQDYYDFLQESFASIIENDVTDLIIDLRGNGGGDDNYGATLVSYLAPETFKYFERIEVTDEYSGYGSVSKIHGRNLMTSHKGLSTWQPQENRFSGTTYVLIDGLSFSTCADVATVLHHHSWAIFLGEETGGGYDGNTSGSSKRLTLSNSNIRINLPMWKYTTANLGHEFYGRAVPPDFPIQQSIDEFVESQDAVLNRAVKMICE